MQTIPNQTDILIIGAGMAGLCAATDLQNAGYEVLVIDKGRGLGGRMASRRIGEASFDHGAQFMTARSTRFKGLLDELTKVNAAKEWYRTKGGVVTNQQEGHPRWCGLPSITAIAKNLAKPLNVYNKKRVSSIQQDGEKWIAKLETDEVIYANSIVLTPPVPQLLALLKNGNIQLSEDIQEQLEAITYERCLAVMAVLDCQSGVPAPGMISGSEAVTLVVDNQQKGISKLPAVTIHATPEFSLEHWDDNRDEVATILLEAAQEYLGSAKVIDYQIHGWLYSRPHKVEEASHLLLKESPPLLVAGDAFGVSSAGLFAGPRVEGAALSGWAAANHLDLLLSI